MCEPVPNTSFGGHPTKGTGEQIKLLVPTNLGNHVGQLICPGGATQFERKNTFLGTLSKDLSKVLVHVRQRLEVLLPGSGQASKLTHIIAKISKLRLATQILLLPLVSVALLLTTSNSWWIGQTLGLVSIDIQLLGML